MAGKKIIAWHIGVVFEDGTEEALADVPDWVATRVDEFLDGEDIEYTLERYLKDVK